MAEEIEISSALETLVEVDQALSKMLRDPAIEQQFPPEFWERVSRVKKEVYGFILNEVN